MMLTDEQIIEIIAQRMDEECGWSKASTVLNHYGWIDVVTHLFCEKGLRGPLMDAYYPELLAATAAELLGLTERESGQDYNDWKADVATRGGV